MIAVLYTLAGILLAVAAAILVLAFGVLRAADKTLAKAHEIQVEAKVLRGDALDTLAVVREWVS